jgi:uncharacterized protein YjbI with pentapeptide repeats
VGAAQGGSNAVAGSKGSSLTDKGDGVKAHPEVDAVEELPNAHRLQRVLGGSDRQTALAEIDGWTLEQLQSNGRGIDLTSAALIDADLSSLNLRGTTLSRATLHGARLDQADLSGASLISPAMEKTSLREAKLSGAYLHALAAQVCDFTGADLSSVLDATGSLLHGCRLVEAVLDGSSLAGATFYQCDLRGSSWRNATLQGATFNECLLDGACFNAANLDQVTMTKCRMDDARFEGATGHGLTIQRPTAAHRVRLDGAELSALRLLNVRGADWSARGAHLRDVDLVDCRLVNAAFTRTNVSGGRFLRSDLTAADFSEASLLGVTISSSSLVGARLDGARAENATIIESALEGASLEEIRARGLAMRDTDLSDAHLRSAYLYRAMLIGDPPRAMSMRRADLRGANLVQSQIAADLSDAKLVGVHAAYARLNQSVLCGADLRGISLYDASLVKTDFTGAHLSMLRPPFFADRCPGLVDALRVAEDTAAIAFLKQLDIALEHGVSGSTMA